MSLHKLHEGIDKVGSSRAALTELILQQVGHKVFDPILGKPEAPDADARRDAKAEQGLPAQMHVAQEEYQQTHSTPLQGNSTYNRTELPPDNSAAAGFHTVPPYEASAPARTYLRPGEDDLREEEALAEGGTAGDDRAI